MGCAGESSNIVGDLVVDFSVMFGVAVCPVNSFRESFSRACEHMQSVFTGISRFSAFLAARRFDISTTQSMLILFTL